MSSRSVRTGLDPTPLLQGPCHRRPRVTPRAWPRTPSHRKSLLQPTARDQLAAMASVPRAASFGDGSFSVARLSAFFLCATCGLLAVQTWRSWWRLRHVPGPFFASLTNLVRAKWATTGEAHLILQRHHETYGDLVRIGPNMVSFSNPEAIPIVYPAKAGFAKVSGTPPIRVPEVRVWG